MADAIHPLGAAAPPVSEAIRAEGVGRLKRGDRSAALLGAPKVLEARRASLGRAPPAEAGGVKEG